MDPGRVGAERGIVDRGRDGLTLPKGFSFDKPLCHIRDELGEVG